MVKYQIECGNSVYYLICNGEFTVFYTMKKSYADNHYFEM